MDEEIKKRISILIPCFNEEENVRPICEAVRNVIKTELPRYDYEIIFIDNKSRDRTRTIIRELCSEDKKVKAIFNNNNYGQFNSPYHGMLQATGDCVIPVCADFQDPPEMIPAFVREWEAGYKIVIGKKTRSKENPFIYFCRTVYYKLIRKMSSVDMIEQFTGFALYDREFLDTLRDLDDPTPFIRGIVAELGPDRKEIEFEQPRRRAGKTHNNFFSLYDAAMLSFTSYTKSGMRVATFAGFIIAFMSFLVGFGFLIAKLVLWDRFIMGYAPMIISIYFVGGVILAFLGFVGEYIMAINTRLMNRPLVVEEERINFERRKKKRPKESREIHREGKK